MKAMRALLHGEESESYLETFLDVLLCGLGAALALLIIYSVLPKTGNGTDRPQTEIVISGLTPAPGTGGTKTDGSVVPLFLINAQRARLDLPDSPITNFFQLFTESRTVAIQERSFRAPRALVQRYGFEETFRLGSFQEPLIIAIHSDLVPQDGSTTEVNIRIFVGGVSDLLTVSITSRPTPGGKLDLYSFSEALARWENIGVLPGNYLPLVKIESDGKMVGQKGLATLP